MKNNIALSYFIDYMTAIGLFIVITKLSCTV